MNAPPIIQSVLVVLYFASVAVGVFAFIDAVIRRADAFVAAGKATKPLWLIITGVATLALGVFGPVSLFGLPAIVAVLVYVVDVRPAVRAVTGGRPPSTSW
jgi:hypothetical protein